jgi:hypothetical protein
MLTSPTLPGEVSYMAMNDFLSRFHYGGLLAVAVGKITNVAFYEDVPEVPDNTDVYFGPATRATEGNLKEDVLGTVALWVDADDPQHPQCTFPPSALVMSGHGWHLYWFVDEPVEDREEIERMNKLLTDDVPTGDPGSWNVNRVLRVPNTINTKEDPVRVELKSFDGIVYKKEDFDVLEDLPQKTRHKIRTGDSRGYRSRSERDWAILTDLVSNGASDELIATIFHYQPCGNKAREARPNYLATSVSKVRARVSSQKGSAGTLDVREDGYYVWNRNGARRVSTFVIKPEILLDGSAYEGSEDAIVGTVSASGYTWPGETFTRSAFTSVARMDKECPIVAWQWLGRDDDVRALLPLLLEQLQQDGLPRVRASSSLGLHFVGDSAFFLGNEQVLSASEIWQGYSGPIAWLPSKREHPELDLRVDYEPTDSIDLITKLNEREAIWPLIGWYGATPLKPWLERKGYRFPILNVAGTKGSGKTTLIQRVFMPLLGQVDPKSYDAGTTRFVTLSLLGSANAVPIAFSEFRYDAVERFIRFVLLAYDTGHDPRGRGDQTTVDYPLSAPFSIDGEDLIADPAARDRIVVVQLHPEVVDEGSEAYTAYHELRDNFPVHFGGHYVQSLLELLSSGELDKLLEDAREQVFDEFPGKLPDRVRANHVVAYLGVLLWCRVTRHEPPGPEVLKRSISSVYDIETGRTRTLADYLIEDIVNAASSGTNSFRWTSSEDGAVLYFQLSSAHSWWLASRRRQGRGALERDAIRAQLKEANYMTEPKLIESAWMYSIELPLAQEMGLDVPNKVNRREVKFKF